jgi:hypothetical protein
MRLVSRCYLFQTVIQLLLALSVHACECCYCRVSAYPAMLQYLNKEGGVLVFACVISAEITVSPQYNGIIPLDKAEVIRAEV